MRALVVSPAAPGRIDVLDVAAPMAHHSEVLVEVRAVSLNRGEMRALRTADAGIIPGWDFAGVLLKDADDQLKAGSRVVGIVEQGAWAELVAVRRDWIAPIPDGVTFAQAAALPIAGLTALRTLRLGGAGIGDRVLITGAGGGVGQLTVQLAVRAGADVTALVVGASDVARISALGAHHVVTDIRKRRQRFDVIIESVGGEVLGRALSMLDPRGSLVTFGNTSDAPTTFNVRDVYNGALVKILGFELFFDPVPFGRDLAVLLDMTARGELNPHVVDILPWTDMAHALERLDNRAVGGKLILTVGQ
jgi:NADPH:quinone reductase